MNLRRLPLRVKVAAAVVSTCAFGVVLSAAGLFAIELWTFQSRAQAEMNALADAVGVGVDSMVAFNDHQEAREFLEELRVRAGLNQVHLVDLEAGSLFASAPESGVLPVSISVQAQGFHRDKDGYWLIRNLYDAKGRPFARLAMSSPLSRLHVERRQAVLWLGTAVAVMLVVSVWVAMRLHRSLTRPILALAEAVERVEMERDPGLRAPRLTDDEIGTLADRINRMLYVLQEQAEALRESDARIRAVNDSLVNGVIYRMVREPDGSRRAAYIGANVQRLNGIAAEAVLADASVFYNQMAPDDRRRIRAAEEASAEGLSVLSEEARFELPDGEVRWFHLTSSPRRGEGGRVIWDGVYIDVTERRLAEEARSALESQLRHSQKLEAIGTLAGGIAHDFNNILAAVLGNIALMRLDIEKGHPALASLDEISRACERARDLVQQIMTFSRRQEQPLKVTRLQPVVEEAVRLLRSTLPAGVAVELHLDPHACPVRAVPSQIHQIILNLVTNAWHAMESRAGRITIRLEPVVVDSRLASTHPDLWPGAYIRLSVADTGRGIPAEMIERIFEPFFTTKPPDQGAGMGLAVVHGIMRSHAGATLVESQVGVGTTFHLYFPQADAECSPAIPDPASLTASGTGERILIVDDEEALVSVAARVLRRYGYRVTTQSTPDQALSVFSKSPQAFDLVFTDLNMPGMSGIELSRKLLALRPDVRIVVASGFWSETEAREARGLGIADMVQKPITMVELSRVVDRALKGHGASEVLAAR